MCREVSTKHNFGDRPWLEFEHVTMVPMCRKLINSALLTSEERQWLNDYHQEVWDKTNDFFKDDKRTMDWLRRETAKAQ